MTRQDLIRHLHHLEQGTAKEIIVAQACLNWLAEREAQARLESYGDLRTYLTEHTELTLRDLCRTLSRDTAHAQLALERAVTAGEPPIHLASLEGGIRAHRQVLHIAQEFVE